VRNGEHPALAGKNAGSNFVFLLRQRRDLYHQLKGLTDEQRRQMRTASPELMLQILTGRRKLIEKLRQVEAKLSLVKSNWSKISSQLDTEHKQQARQMLEQADRIAGHISTENFTEARDGLSVFEFNPLDELLVE
jgi:molecular chaperone DnaK (HSP70)